MYNKEDKAVETKKIKLKKKKHRFLHRGKHKHSYQLFKISPARDLQCYFQFVLSEYYCGYFMRLSVIPCQDNK